MPAFEGRGKRASTTTARCVVGGGCARSEGDVRGRREMCAACVGLSGALRGGQESDRLWLAMRMRRWAVRGRSQRCRSGRGPPLRHLQLTVATIVAQARIRSGRPDGATEAELSQAKQSGAEQDAPYAGRVGARGDEQAGKQAGKQPGPKGSQRQGWVHPRYAALRLRCACAAQVDAGSRAPRRPKWPHPSLSALRNVHRELINELPQCKSGRESQSRSSEPRTGHVRPIDRTVPVLGPFP
ncbi:uncharacterized protein PSFLO_06732 [Pseudozyma flocculosa]|uniref:Uncharacterized protein n=1 Tax=Pseudozyma flocculosa TaxID=84751 RepID=A0A5C3FAK2_9BASI|nr:uncharacterized protein PSFLO_06732 [Pseudozyma flocculosa]